MNKVPSIAIPTKDTRTRSNRACCVVGCRNTERKNPELQLYSFPGREWEKDRKQKWIIAVDRQKNWVPTKNSRICSIHFVGGAKSNDPRKEAYIPTLFLTMYKQEKSIGLNPAEKVDVHNKEIEQRMQEMNNNVDVTFDIHDLLNNPKIEVQLNPD